MKKPLIILGSVFLLIIMAICLFSVLLQNQNPYKSKQDSLANELGVKVTDYPYQHSFPAGYFNEILKSGMTVDEVHKIIKGYEKAYRCRSPVETYYYREVYYYYSLEDTKALRFQVFFDKQEKFTRLEGEDDDSRTILIKDCELGIIEQ
ncbi:MAG TPA: hypothetical protein VMT46_05455 [Anaerolineaceae bacterium]|nr:hypothetical protein [Anaerolineaceae bacterium]